MAIDIEKIINESLLMLEESSNPAPEPGKKPFFIGIDLDNLIDTPTVPEPEPKDEFIPKISLDYHIEPQPSPKTTERKRPKRIERLIKLMRGIEPPRPADPFYLEDHVVEYAKEKVEGMTDKYWIAKNIYWMVRENVSYQKRSKSRKYRSASQTWEMGCGNCAERA